MPNPNSPQDLRILLQENAWLEPEHFALAQKISSLEKTNHNTSWQIYLNTLALLGLEVWLEKSLPDEVIIRDIDRITTAGYLNADKFKICAIATESLLCEVVEIPKAIIENPGNFAHFYVVVEVLEENEEVVIKGFLSHKQLIESKNNFKLPISDGCYQIPLSFFDMEPNHLSLYQRYVEASEFLPLVAQSQVTQTNQIAANIISKTTTKLSKWLQGVIDESWQALDSLKRPEFNLDYSLRSIDDETKRTKIIDLGINLDSHKVALVICISPDNLDSANHQSKISVLAQLRPMDGDDYLPQNIKLILISKAGKVLQEITSNFQDKCIQLNVLKGEPGKQFSIKVSLGDSSIMEKFEL
ncbi:hypothetical protein NIES267_34370 [Calothrix parasitica NIES-267]|uniref:DUF1822 domain-containing protein n=1 Tax=Calothrix parasitica NIES-267 TaxID=1973488 RepID=A0A1Z4LRS4_9CYAN|nr:hypothetical protein NIES267_34370 [Calothrix parasitica NIES-267]